MEYKLFMITPYSCVQCDVWTEALLPAVNRINKLKNYTINPTRADFKLLGLEFEENLHKHLNETDLCLCDITGLNPNVMYEIGYARAIKKKTIIIREGEQDIPVDIQDKYVYSYDTQEMNKLSLYLESAINKGIDVVRTRQTNQQLSYEVICFKDRDSSDLGNKISEAMNQIAILETNVSTVLKTYLEQLKKALNKNKGLSIRILTLDPDSSFVNNRAAQLGVPVGQYREELHDSIRSLLTALQEYGDRINLKIYNDFPTQITFMVDDAIYSCSIARSNRSRKLCTFKLHQFNTGAERTFQFHFEAVWGFGEAYVFHKKTLQQIV